MRGEFRWKRDLQGKTGQLWWKWGEIGHQMDNNLLAESREFKAQEKMVILCFLQRKSKRNQVAEGIGKYPITTWRGRNACTEFWAAAAQRPIFGGWQRKHRKIHAKGTVHWFANNTKNVIFWEKYGKFGFWCLLSDDVIGGVGYGGMTWQSLSGSTWTDDVVDR